MSHLSSTIGCVTASTSAQTPQGPYWYENLGEDDFQHLCSALIAHKYDNVTCYPVGQKDGGRDIKRKTSDGDLIYQVKWSKNAIRNPISWLTTAIEGEKAKIKRHAADGATRYILITSVAGTSAMAKDASGHGSGTMDKLDKALADYATEFGLKLMECWWRKDLDDHVVTAPTNILWRFQKMLAGAEALRFVLEANHAEIANDRLALLIRKTVSAQWSQDSKVKFKQAELDNDDLQDLFIDVKALIMQPVADRAVAATPLEPAGAVDYLLKTEMPFTLVRGEPGQGKSTLGQQLCQVYRSPFIDDDPGNAVKRPEVKPRSKRVPLRVDLRDYGSWLDGYDPFTEAIAAPGKPPKPRANGGLEHFLASGLTHWAVVDKVDLVTVNDLLNRYPMLIVLDGLDEVAQRDTRSRVVRQIETFAGRWRYGGVPPKIVVTTRPNVADLPEPSGKLFETATLVKLDRELRNDYLRKWCTVRAIKGPDKRSLMHSFDTRTAEPHIAQLAENPMQLTILLYLLHLRGQSVPDRRTALYDDYMRTFLDREAEKSASVRDNRTNLEEVTAYLGWFLHGWAEQQGTAGRLKTSELRTQIFSYLDQAHKDTGLVDALFTNVTHRVWALSSKAQGTFEFDVQPVREFFAAKYLYKYASADKSDILNALIRRPFWFNASRFFAGFANPNEIGGLVDGLSEEFAACRHPLQARTAAWTLLADGVFSSKVTAQDRAVGLLLDDLSIRLLHEEMQNEGLPVLPPDSGATTLAERLLADAATTPADPLSLERVGLVSALGLESPALGEWWLSKALPALGGKQQTTWLGLGASWSAGSLLEEADRKRLSFPDNGAVTTAIAAGVVPAPGSELERKFVDTVLAGHCSDVRSAQTGLVADLVNALASRQFIHLAKAPNLPVFETNSGHCGTLMADLKRADAFRRLKTINAAFGKIQQAMNIVRKSTNTVQPWSDAAEHLRSMYGPSWLATDIAVIGAAIDPMKRRDLGPMSPRGAPFGPDIHYGNLVNDVRIHRNDKDWWTRVRSSLEGGDRATWLYALVAVASPEVVEECLEKLISTMGALDAHHLAALLSSSSRLGLSGVGRRLPATLAMEAVKTSVPAALLLMHYADDLSGSSNLKGFFTARQLADMGRLGVVGWPALRAAGRELVGTGSADWLDVLEAHGPHALAGIAQGPLPATVCQAILGAPGKYPRKWVAVAELTVSQLNNEPDLLSATDNWFE
jgi:hypothetical protein